MSDAYYVEEEFTSIDFSKQGLSKGDYEACVFTDCTLANQDLSHINFIECEFKNCDLSMAKTFQMSLRDVVFEDCKLVGLQFDQCNDTIFAIHCSNCQLNVASLQGVNLKRSTFKNCRMHEVDFLQADALDVLFDECDFEGAVFERTNLKESDFSTSYNYVIDPENNYIEGARFSLQGLPGLVKKYGIVIN